MKLPNDKATFDRRLKSAGAYFIVSYDGGRVIEMPVSKIPMSPIFTADEQQWLEVELPIERTRFNIPAWVELRYRYGVKK